MSRDGDARAGFGLVILVAALFAAGSVAAAGRGIDRPPTVASPPATHERPTFDLRAASDVLLSRRPSSRVTQDALIAQRPSSDVTEDDLVFDDSDDLSDENVNDVLDEDQLDDDIDPLEPVNRVMFDINLTLDKWLLRPIARIYNETVPEPGRTGIANVLDNVESPVVFANDLLQGEMSRAGATFARFFINTIFGFAGLIDVADAVGLPGHGEDFGQTLASYGVGGSPYLVLPLFGPTNPRDATNLIIDTAFDPLTFVTPDTLQGVKTPLEILSNRAAIIQETDALEATSVDYYAAVRSFYYQNREFEIGNGRVQEQESPMDVEIEDDLFDALDEDADSDLPDVDLNEDLFAE